MSSRSHRPLPSDRGGVRELFWEGFERGSGLSLESSAGCGGLSTVSTPGLRAIDLRVIADSSRPALLPAAGGRGRAARGGRPTPPSPPPKVLSLHPDSGHSALKLDQPTNLKGSGP